MSLLIKLFVCISLLYIYQPAFAQSIEFPSFNILRAEQNYSFLTNIDDRSYRKNLTQAIKYLPIGNNKEFYLTLGGELRPRVEHFTNRRWNANDDETFYSQRISVNANLKLGDKFRFFTELYHGYTSDGKKITESDKLAIHQGFFDFIPLNDDNKNLSIRFGRQEMLFGVGRLVGLREGPNIRRSFDSVRAIYKHDESTWQALYGNEVQLEFDEFDNDFNLFDTDANDPILWGFYGQFKVPRITGNNELYYLGFDSDNSRFNDVTGAERRHTVGLRRFGTLGKEKAFSYNTELMYQFGDLGDSDIEAYNIELDSKYKFINTTWQWQPGIKLEWSSGDSEAGDGEINTFNPMFVNPAYYSLAQTITPANVVSIHPSLTFYPAPKLKIYLEWAKFWRASDGDGLYRPPRFLVRDATGVSDKNIGEQIGFSMTYTFNKHWLMDLQASYFKAGSFLDKTGDSDNIFHIVPTLQYKF